MHNGSCLRVGMRVRTIRGALVRVDGAQAVDGVWQRVPAGTTARVVETGIGLGGCDRWVRLRVPERNTEWKDLEINVQELSG